ncbi:hypothetical protein SAMN05421743_102138 [Thalassobacillus cyri]|uniref:Uncharacterized protein n=1 Tax=Thalassobacillus cyri TaxID=571932 RepID=A0A1H3XFN8_9BACI|nr:hypothetical protein [Thalassobacillus cyri]SDZ98166.1 hypothetical protein SAMN05421743_102138 [Thalassobacillus cyri]
MDNLLTAVLGFVLLAGILPFVKVITVKIGSFYSSWFNEAKMVSEELTGLKEVVAGFVHENSFVQIRGPTSMAGKAAIGNLIKFRNQKTFPNIRSG